MKGKRLHALAAYYGYTNTYLSFAYQESAFMPSTISGSLETRFSWTYNRAAGARQHAHTTCRAHERHSLAIAHCVYVQGLLFSPHRRLLTATAIPTMATLTKLYLLWLHLLSYTYDGYTY